MTLEYDQNERFSALVPILDEYTEWFMQLVRRIMYPQSASGEQIFTKPLSFIDWLEAEGPNLKPLLTHTLSADKVMAARVQAVTRSVQMKADIVERDETEQGDRALLNLGHTFCHALEAATGYSDRLLHGEGVAIGCALAFEVSQRLGLCSQEDPSRVRAHLKDMGMKADLADIAGDLPDAEGLLALMAQDKKVVDGQLRFILARGIGAAFVTADVPADTVLSVLRDGLSLR